MYAKIQPVICYPSTATKLICPNVNIRNLGGDCYADIAWQLFSDTNEKLQYNFLKMPKEDYDLWGTDDTYILNYVASKLNLSIIEIVIQENNND